MSILRNAGLGRRWVALALLVALCGLGLRAAQPPGAAAGSPHVVIISLDGFPGWALDDPALPVPTLRRLAREGAMARGMRPVNPTVTWPNHTSMVTGVTPARHGVLFNGTLVREPGLPPRVEPWRDKAEMVRARTLYDAAHEQGLTTAQVDWVAIWNAPTVTWEFRERPDPQGPIARELVEAGLVSETDVQAFATRNIVFRDHVWTTAAAHILRRHRPNLLLFHLLNLDSTHHRYGPRTHAALTTMAWLDTQVAAILDALDEGGIAERTTVFVVSDHGFKAVRRQIRPNVALERAGLVEVVDGKVTRTRAWVVPEGGTAIVYLTAPDPDGRVLARVRKEIAELEGVARLIEPSEYAALGLPDPADDPQMGVLLASAKDGYAFTAALGADAVIDAPEGSLGAHGYLASDPDLSALFVASGRGIARGVVLDAVDAVDVAPTAAQLLGLEMKGVDGRVLTAILADGKW
ncbi:MAG TPA: ectonucleotide pyrophosphatase/phosphodiesterase [Vicinamibacterales bacterium]|nr:ectonucleotide pyrophosphatase/phosphodiesterase [Vicinamibacterales bacterium]